MAYFVSPTESWEYSKNPVHLVQDDFGPIGNLCNMQTHTIIQKNKLCIDATNIMTKNPFLG